MDEAAEKLDSMMSQVFNHISNCRREGQLASTWQALLDSFFATVLITHKSKFTQYLLWHILHQVSAHIFSLGGRITACELLHCILIIQDAGKEGGERVLQCAVVWECFLACPMGGQAVRECGQNLLASMIVLIPCFIHHSVK